VATVVTTTATVVAAIVAAAIATLVAATVATLVAPTVATAIVAARVVAATLTAAAMAPSVGLRFQADHDDGHGREAQRQSNNISLHQKYLQKLGPNKSVNLMSDGVRSTNQARATMLLLAFLRQMQFEFRPSPRKVDCPLRGKLASLSYRRRYPKAPSC
jgi:hypothetical protein